MLRLGLLIPGYPARAGYESENVPATKFLLSHVQASLAKPPRAQRAPAQPTPEGAGSYHSAVTSHAIDAPLVFSFGQWDTQVPPASTSDLHDTRARIHSPAPDQLTRPAQNEHLSTDPTIARSDDPWLPLSQLAFLFGMHDQVAKPAALSTVVLAGRGGSTQSPERHLPNMEDSLPIRTPFLLTRPRPRCLRKRPLHLGVLKSDLAAAYCSTYPTWGGQALRLNVLPRLLYHLRTWTPSPEDLERPL